MTENLHDDVLTLEPLSEQVIRRLRRLATGCLFLGACSILGSIFQGVVEHHAELLDPSWFLVGAAGGLLNGRPGWRKFVLVISWIVILIAPIGTVLCFLEVYSLSRANIPGTVLAWFSAGALPLLVLLFLGVWTIRLLRVTPVHQYFLGKEKLSPPLSRRTKWICWIAALFVSALATGTQLYWKKKFVRAEGFAKSTSYRTDGTHRMHMVETLYIYGRPQALVFQNKEGTINSCLRRNLHSNHGPPRGFLERPTGKIIAVPGEVNIFEIVDGTTYREEFLEITQEETEAYLDQASMPFGIDDLKRFITEYRSRSSTTP